MTRESVLWVLVVFFGGSIIFGMLGRLTEDSPAGVRIAVQLGALALVIGVVVVAVRRLRD